MKVHTASLFAIALAAAAVTPAFAADKDDATLSDCVTLSDGYNTTRFGSQFLLVKNGDEHYKVSFNGNQCAVLSTTTTPSIKTGGEANKLCPKGTSITGRNGGRQESCRVRSVETITADKFAEYRRGNR